jgi:hypothetical protein
MEAGASGEFVAATLSCPSDCWGSRREESDASTEEEHARKDDKVLLSEARRRRPRTQRYRTVRPAKYQARSRHHWYPGPVHRSNSQIGGHLGVLGERGAEAAEPGGHHGPEQARRAQVGEVRGGNASDSSFAAARSASRGATARADARAVWVGQGTWPSLLVSLGRCLSRR